MCDFFVYLLKILVLNAISLMIFYPVKGEVNTMIAETTRNNSDVTLVEGKDDRWNQTNLKAPANSVANGDLKQDSPESNLTSSTAESIGKKNATYAENIQLPKIIFYDSEGTEDDEPHLVGQRILSSTSKMCGAFLGKRVSFGVETTLLEFPWSALLVYNTTERFHCGGTLITHRYVLTAAHCVTEHFYPLIAVRIGEHNISSAKDCAEDVGGDQICSEDPIDAGIEKVIRHGRYSRRTHINDIAMIRLDQHIQFTRHHYPICLPQSNDHFPNLRMGTITGWGATEKSLRSTVLMRADVPVLNMSECARIYRSSFNNDKVMCASGVNEVDICKGDSGGPLFSRVYRDRRTRCVQVGVISLGVGTCGDTRYLPAIFTRVNFYIKWIQKNLEDESGL